MKCHCILCFFFLMLSFFFQDVLQGELVTDVKQHPPLASPKALRRLKLEEPQLSIVVTLQPPNAHLEQQRDIPFSNPFFKSRLGFDASKKQDEGELYIKFGDVSVMLLKYIPDEEHSSNVILKFLIVCATEAFDIPEVSWNQQDDLLVAAGDDWHVKLTNYKEIWEP